MGSSVPASAPAPPPSPPLDRTAADEAADEAAAIDRLAGNAFDDWPNEAGFDDLREERGPIEIPVVGTIPAWAAGNLYRTGPGQSKVEGTPAGTLHISHWFDGLAHMHRFEIVGTDGEDGEDTPPVRVFYSSRRQSAARVRALQARGTAGLFSFAQRSDPCIGLLGKLMTTFQAAAAASRRRPGRRRARDTDDVNVAVFVDLPVHAVPSPPDADVPDVSKKTASSGHRHPPLPASLWVTTDADVLRRVDPRTLEPIGVAAQTALHPDLRGALSSAHAQRDPATGDLFNFNLELGPAPVYRVFRVAAATGRTDILATIRCGRAVRPAYIHSFFLTARYVVLCIPATHVAHGGLQMLWARNVVDGLEPFDPACATRWVVVDRGAAQRGVVAEFESPAGFFFHSVNAFEQDDQEGGTATTSILCDVVHYPTSDILHALYYDVLVNRRGAAAAFFRDRARAANINPSLTRFRLRLPKDGGPGGRGSVGAAVPVWSIPGPHAGELPTIHPARATRPHRYVYAVCSHGRSTLADGLCKTDTATRAARFWHAPRGHTPGEAIFVARPGAEDGDGDGDEDNGVLLSVVLDGTAARSYLLCLDARTMQETGRAEVGFAVGLGFHGVHASSRARDGL